MPSDDPNGTDWVLLVTLDEVHVDVVREVLEDAGIALRLRPVKRELEGTARPLVPRPLVEIEVEERHQGRALALLDELEQQSEEAAETEAEQSRAAGDEERDRGPLWRRALRWITGQPSPGGTDDGSHA